MNQYNIDPNVGDIPEMDPEFDLRSDEGDDDCIGYDEDMEYLDHMDHL